jgi:cytochrome b561
MPEPDGGLVPKRPRWQRLLLLAIVIGLLIVVLVLHLSGVVGAKTNM